MLRNIYVCKKKQITVNLAINPWMLFVFALLYVIILRTGVAFCETLEYWDQYEKSPALEEQINAYKEKLRLQEKDVIDVDKLPKSREQRIAEYYTNKETQTVKKLPQKRSELAIPKKTTTSENDKIIAEMQNMNIEDRIHAVRNNIFDGVCKELNDYDETTSGILTIPKVKALVFSYLQDKDNTRIFWHINDRIQYEDPHNFTASLIGQCVSYIKYDRSGAVNDVAKQVMLHICTNIQLINHAAANNLDVAETVANSTLYTNIFSLLKSISDNDR